jgi:hypothetical protein
LPRRGAAFEKLMATIERAGLASVGARVEAPGYLPDRDTGLLREHDLLVRQRIGVVDVIIAIECRDRKRPVGVPEVESFADKCSSTGVSQPVIVSKGGFHRSAIRKARSRNVRCFSLSEALTLDWCKMGKMRLVARELTKVTIEARRHDWPVDEIIALVKDDTDLNDADLKQMGLRFLQSLGPIGDNEHCSATLEKEFVTSSPPLRARLKDRSVIDIEQLCITINWLVKCTEVPWHFLLRRDEIGAGKIVESVAVANFNTQGLGGSLVIRHTEQGGAIFWIPIKLDGQKQTSIHNLSREP